MNLDCFTSEILYVSLWTFIHVIMCSLDNKGNKHLIVFCIFIHSNSQTSSARNPVRGIRALPRKVLQDLSYTPELYGLWDIMCGGRRPSRLHSWCWRDGPRQGLVSNFTYTIITNLWKVGSGGGGGGAWLPAPTPVLTVLRHSLTVSKPIYY